MSIGTPPLLVFPTLPGLTFTVVKSPGFNTLIDPAPNAYEVRLAQTVNPVWTWTLIYDFLHDFFWGSFSSVSELRTLMGFFNGQYGKANSFLFSDPDDNAVGPGLIVSTPNIPLAQLQVVNNGAGHYYSPLQRTLDGVTYEDITDLNPQNGTGLQVWANGTPVGSPSTLLKGPGLAVPGKSFMGLYVDWGTTNPAQPVTAAFNFYFRVRFDSDMQDFEKFLALGDQAGQPPAGQGGGYWTVGGSESQNGSGTLKLRTARPAPL